jgi:hypothetical protein
MPFLRYVVLAFASWAVGNFEGGRGVFIDLVAKFWRSMTAYLSRIHQVEPVLGFRKFHRYQLRLGWLSEGGVLGRVTSTYQVSVPKNVAPKINFRMFLSCLRSETFWRSRAGMTRRHMSIGTLRAIHTERLRVELEQVHSTAWDMDTYATGRYHSSRIW